MPETANKLPADDVVMDLFDDDPSLNDDIPHEDTLFDTPSRNYNLACIELEVAVARNIAHLTPTSLLNSKQRSRIEIRRIERALATHIRQVNHAHESTCHGSLEELPPKKGFFPPTKFP